MYKNFEPERQNQDYQDQKTQKAFRKNQQKVLRPRTEKTQSLIDYSKLMEGIQYCVNLTRQNQNKIDTIKEQLIAAMDDFRRQFSGIIQNRLTEVSNQISLQCKCRSQFDPDPIYNCVAALKDGINVSIVSGTEGISQAIYQSQMNLNQIQMPQVNVDLSNPTIKVEQLRINPNIQISPQNEIIVNPLQSGRCTVPQPSRNPKICPPSVSTYA